MFAALVLREHSLRSATGFATAPLSECVFCAGFLPPGESLACSVRCRVVRDSLLEAMRHAVSWVRGSAEPAVLSVPVLLGPAPPGPAHVRAVRAGALPVLDRDVLAPPVSQSLIPRVSPPSNDSARTSFADKHPSDARASFPSGDLVGPLAALADVVGRRTLYPDRALPPPNIVGPVAAFAEVGGRRTLYRDRALSPPTSDDSSERPASNGAAPAAEDALGLTALRDAVSAWVAAGVAADARREATAASCSALVEGAAAAVADCARAFSDAGCTVEAERYRGVARAGFDVDGFRARFAAVSVEVRVMPLGGVYTVHGVRDPLVQRFALYRAELRDASERDTWAWHIEVDRTGSACVVVLRGLSRHVLCAPESASTEPSAFARELDALAAGFARRAMTCLDALGS